MKSLVFWASSREFFRGFVTRLSCLLSWDIIGFFRPWKNKKFFLGKTFLDFTLELEKCARSLHLHLLAESKFFCSYRIFLMLEGPTITLLITGSLQKKINIYNLHPLEEQFFRLPLCSVIIR